MKKDTSLTPLDLIQKLGRFDLDVCGIKTHKTADKIIELPEDGLYCDWSGRVWLNPPYSNPSPWLEKMSIHNNGIALVLNSTDTDWFHKYIFNQQSAILFMNGRPKFTRIDGSVFSIMRGVVLVAYGIKNFFLLETSGIDGCYIEV
jgi:hypothetical protein